VLSACSSTSEASIYGNTRAVAEAIAEAIGERAEVLVVNVAEVDAGALQGANLLVVGGPTHMHGLSSSLSRRLSARAGEEDGHVHVEPHAADGPGLRGWLSDLSGSELGAAAFDTPARPLAGSDRSRRARHRPAAGAPRLQARRRARELLRGRERRSARGRRGRSRTRMGRNACRGRAVRGCPGGDRTALSPWLRSGACSEPGAGGLEAGSWRRRGELAGVTSRDEPGAA
jgi:Flavodoxin domain